MAETLRDVCLLATEHNVCKAYLAKLQQLGLQPEQLMFFKPAKGLRTRVRGFAGKIRRDALSKLSGFRAAKPGERSLDIKPLLTRLTEYCTANELVSGDFSRSARELINDFAGVRRVTGPHINSPEVIQAVASCSQRYVIFCGGGILRREILSLPKRFIHIHPGVVPDVKGADGILWSSLVHGRIGMSAFFMNEGIDTGDVIRKQEYEIPNLFDDQCDQLSSSQICRFIVNFVDPVFRADLLGSLFQANPDPNQWVSVQQDKNAGKVYYFMHDKLRELAVREWYQDGQERSAPLAGSA